MCIKYSFALDIPLRRISLCQVTNLDYDEHKGRIAIGRVNAGRIRKGENIVITVPGGWAGLGGLAVVGGLMGVWRWEG